MGWIEESRDKRKKQNAVMAELTDIRRNGGRGAPGSLDPADFVVMASQARYLGGWDSMRDLVQIQINIRGADFVTSGSYQTLPDLYAHLPWADVAWVEIVDGSRAKSRVAATVAFGVAGLGTKASEEFVEILFHRHDGAIAAFRVSGVRSADVRARAGATFRSAGVMTEKPSTARSHGSDRSVVDELERLAALHASGALTDEEFDGFKQQLRGNHDTP